MKHIQLILSFSIICACTQHTPDSIHASDTAHAANSAVIIQKDTPSFVLQGSPLITSENVGLIHLGQRIQDVKQAYHIYDISVKPGMDYGFDGPGNGLLVHNKMEDLIFIVTDEGNADDTAHVRIIEVLSRKFHTQGGISIGMTAGRLKKHNPDMFLSQSFDLSSLEYYYDEVHGITYAFINQGDKTIGRYQRDSTTTKDIDTSATIAYMTVSNDKQ